MNEDTANESTPANAPAGPYALEDLFDLSAPQGRYRDMMEQAPVHRIMDGFVMVMSREAIDETFRDPQRFSSAYGGGVPLGNVRPLIPLSVDPPDHAKYRKVLDPLFAPKRMDAIEGDIWYFVAPPKYLTVCVWLAIQSEPRWVLVASA